MIVEKMKAADGIDFVAPIYGMNISGQLKTFIDRIAFLYHKPELIAKPVITLLSTDFAGVKPMAFYMEYMLSAMGMRTVGTCISTGTQSNTVSRTYI